MTDQMIFKNLFSKYEERLFEKRGIGWGLELKREWKRFGTISERNQPEMNTSFVRQCWKISCN